MGLTEATLSIRGESILAPQHVSDVLRQTDTPQLVGIDASYPFAESSLWPSVSLSRANVRGPYDTGIRVEDCWNARLQDCFVNGLIKDDAENANPTAMKVGIDLIGSMDAHITGSCVTCAQIGIRASTSPDGYPRSEGLHITDGFLMHVNTGVELNGSNLGGWPTPVAHIVGPHIAFHRFAIRATSLSWLDIHRANCYGSAYNTTDGKWCIYLVGCRDVEITNVGFWNNWATPGFFGGIVLDQCENVDITGGKFVGSITLALHATARCRNVRTNGKVWDVLAKQGKVANFAQ